MPYSYDELMAWGLREKVYPMTPPQYGPCDYHRAQIERWLWDARDRMRAPIIEIGAEFEHNYLSWGYWTLNTHAYDTPHANVRPAILGDVQALPFRDNSLETIICTEVLEHVPNLFRAVGEIQRVLAPGGSAFMATPFMWPMHDTLEYQDFWRITEQGYRFMFGGCESVTIIPIQMRRQSQFLWNEVAKWEVMGNVWETSAPTGYCVEARK